MNVNWEHVWNTLESPPLGTAFNCKAVCKAIRKICSENRPNAGSQLRKRHGHHCYVSSFLYWINPVDLSSIYCLLLPIKSYRKLSWFSVLLYLLTLIFFLTHVEECRRKCTMGGACLFSMKVQCPSVWIMEKSLCITVTPPRWTAYFFCVLKCTQDMPKKVADL